MKYLIFFLIHASVSQAKCILPEADDMENASPPLMSGLVKKNNGSSIVVVSKENKRIYTFDVSKISSGKIFSQHGGMISANEIKNGAEVKIWTLNCVKVKNKASIARIMVTLE